MDVAWVPTYPTINLASTKGATRFTPEQFILRASRVGAGVSFRTAVSTDYVQLLDTAVTQRTLLAFVVGRNGTGSTVGIIGPDNSNNSVNLKMTALFKWRAAFYDGAQRDAADTVDPTGYPQLIIGVADTDGFGKLYVDGAFRSQVAIGTITSQIGDTRIGGMVGGSSTDANVQIFLTAGWTRALSASEVRQLSLNPWQIFLKPRRTIFTGAPVIEHRRQRVI
jgi:hypothetical protein